MTRHRNDGLRKICSCPRRVWAKCRHPWHFNLKVRGGPHYRFSLDRHLGRRIDSKTEADAEAARIKSDILAGCFGQAATRADLMLRQLADVYLERYVAVERAATQQAFRGQLTTICRTVVPRPTGGSAPFGDWVLTDIVTDTVERFREVRRAGGAGVVGVNRNLGSLRGLFNWAVRVGYAETTPFKRGSETVIKLSRELPRSRRLDPDEERRLVIVCAAHLRAVVAAALETGMRRGEILSLQWKQVEGLTVEGLTVVWGPRPELALPAWKTKGKRDRRIPISTRLRGVLEMRRLDPASRPHGPEAYVFGTEIGTRVRSVKRAWGSAVLKAHGYSPAYMKSGQLTEASRAVLRTIDLRVHDLRREAGSRWLEGGVPLHTIRDWLGHSNIAQTSTYLASTAQSQHDAMRRYEARREALQPFATDVGEGGLQPPLGTVGSDDTGRKTGGDPNKVIM